MFRRLTIRKRLTLVLWGAALLAFAVAGAGLALYQRLTLESRARQIMEPYVQFVATATETAVAFEEPVRAQEMLAPLRANSQIREAQIILADGRVLASYGGVSGAAPTARTFPPDGIYVGRDLVELLRSLNHGARLHLTMSVAQLSQQTHKTLWMFGAGVLVFLAITLGQLVVLQRTLIRPVTALSEAAELIRTRADYSHRVPVAGDDELARLGQGFNAMMEAVEDRRQALQQVSAFQRAILDNAAYAIVSAAPDGVVTSFNPAAERLLGYTAAEVVGKRTPTDWHDPEEVAQRARQFAEELEENIAPGFEVFAARARRNLPNEFEWTQIRKDGTRVPTLLSVTALRDEAGRITGFVGLISDLTERKKAEHELQITHLGVEQSGIAVIRATADARIIGVNGAACRNLGYTPEELCRLTVLDIDPTFNPKQWSAHRRELIAQGATTFEGMQRRKDGTTYPVEVTVSYHVRDGQEFSISFARDITERKRAEQALREKTEELDHYFTSALDLLCIADTDGYFRRLNPAWESTIGYAIAELEGRRFMDLVHPDDMEATLQAVSQLAKQKEVSSFTNRFRHKDGSYRWIEWRSFPSGKLIFTVARDITERRRAEHALQKFQYSIDQSSDAIFWITREAKFSYVNEQACRSLGYTREELMRLCLWDIDPVYPKERWNENWERYQAGRQGGGENIETIQRRKDGSTFPVEVVSNHIWFGDEELHVAAVRDITERKQAEEALRTSEERFRALVETSPDWVWDTNEHGIYTYASPRSKELLGYEPAEILGRTPFDFMPPEEVERVKLEFEKAAAARVPFAQLENKNLRKDGRLVVLETSGVPIFDAGGVFRGYRGVDRDITERKQAEQALKENESLLRRSQSVARLGSYVLDAHTGKWISSPALDEVFGIDDRHPKDVEGWMALVHPEDKAEMLDHLRNHVLAGRNRFEKAYRIIRPDNGQERWVFGLGELEFDADGNAARMIGTIQDITERKQAEIARQRTVSLVLATLESTADGILVVDAAGQIAEYNQRFAELWRLPKEALESKDEQAAMRHVLDQLKDPAVFTAKVQELYARQESDSFDLLEFKDGRVFERYSRPQMVEGRAVGRVWSFRDISERKRAELALQDSEQKFRTLFEHMAEGVALHELIYNAQGEAVDYRIIDANPAFGRHTGLIPEKARGQRASDFYGTGSPPYLAEWAEVVRTGKPLDFEFFFAPLERHFHISAVSPKPGFFATVFEDITDRKRTEEELRRKNEELERFTYTVSHDLKSPLITIKGFTGALLQDLAAGRQQRLAGDLQRIAGATDKMAELLQDLLELSRIGRIMNPPVDVPLGPLVRDVLELLAGPVRECGAKVVVQPDLPVVRGDARRLLEVFQNLIENSLRFMGKQPRPQVEIGLRDQDGGRVFFVRDNGAGIEPRYHETVFGLFNKLDAKTAGTGIGLALVRRIIGVHGGKIWVESAGRNQGSTFCFTLPATPTPRKEKQT